MTRELPPPSYRGVRARHVGAAASQSAELETARTEAAFKRAPRTFFATR